MNMKWITYRDLKFQVGQFEKLSHQLVGEKLWDNFLNCPTAYSVSERRRCAGLSQC
jgi:hypothetical protein